MLEGVCLYIGLNYLGQRFFVFRQNKNRIFIESPEKTNT
jgi:hypothetical protein